MNLRLRWVAPAVLFAGACAAPASLHQPDDPMIVPVRPNGAAEPYPYDEFKRRLSHLLDLLNPTLKSDQGPTARDRLAGSVNARRGARGATAAEAAALGADMVRLGNTNGGFFVNEALNLLTPRARDRRPDYFVLTTIATAHAYRGEWAEAADYHTAALLDSEMPAAVKGWSAPQRDWVARVDREYTPRYLAIRKSEAEARPAPETEGPTPLFPVRFVDDAGAYTPGAVAAAERAKLPPDAVAVVQQLLLWFPTDTRLFWLLGELYAAEGQFRPARAVLDECVEARQFSNRRVLVDHRSRVQAAAAAQPRGPDEAPLLTANSSDAPDPETDPGRDLPISMRTVKWYFAIVAACAALALVRVLRRRVKPG